MKRLLRSPLMIALLTVAMVAGLAQASDLFNGNGDLILGPDGGVVDGEVPIFVGTSGKEQKGSGMIVTAGDLDSPGKGDFTGLATDAEFQISTTTVEFVDTPYTVLATDFHLVVDTTGGAVVLDFPTSASSGVRVYCVKDNGDGDAVNKVTLDPSGAETIDGQATIDIIVAYGGTCIYPDPTLSTGWLIKP